ncbi:hypothetical protein MAR_032413 [Mya arenaria]|uniref:Uncharacterized protein n=1 Tax=Mya arenaria TaxID=6604 RepID=A0ABY7F8Y1_MYAAR|nr:hypothetical protein MAR_032413 [Mya arenaria]
MPDIPMMTLGSP